jgi:hypothetical protein
VAPRLKWRIEHVAGLSALLACGACKQSDDIVANGKGSAGAGGGLHVETINTCEPGHYHGAMYTQPAESGSNNFPFVADISFRLVETMRGEFSVLQDTAKLTGTAADGSGSHFEADIVAGDSGCGSENTAFTTDLENGNYYSGQSTIGIPFTGTILGHYKSTSTDAPLFSGSWSATLRVVTGDVMVVGGWFAGRIP